MSYNPQIHHRRSIRLRGFDYASAGAYFVTTCTQDRELLLEGATVLCAVECAWVGLPARFGSVVLDEFVIMPNHVHAIVFLTPESVQGGASPAPTKSDIVTLYDVVCAFKSVSAIAANKILGRQGRPFWQRDYYERIIRNDEELSGVRQYIRDNPAKWSEDKHNPGNWS